MVEMSIPKEVSNIIEELYSNGFDAYIVGGCVRDYLLQRKPHDWDITTNAMPEDIIRIFEKTVPTGVKYGTVSVFSGGTYYEVTTYRIDGEYTDMRRPDSVLFTGDIVEDLKRRDFTMNAIAYNEFKGFVDPFDGYADIKNGCIRCVGNPDLRFGEDALRMLRAIRFSAQLGFDIVEETYFSIKRNSKLIQDISMERIKVELDKIMLSDVSKFRILNDVGILSIIIPELSRLEGVEQNTPYHRYNVFEHTLFATEAIEKELHLKLAMLFHDTGKVEAKTTDDGGRDHFYAHEKYSVNISKDILKRLKYDNETKKRVLTLIGYHDYKVFPNKKSIKNLLKKLGDVGMFRDLLKIQWADALAKSPVLIKDRILNLIKIEGIFDEILRSGECFRKEDLDITGRDLIKAGIEPGKKLGNVLEVLLGEVIDKPELNNRDELMSRSLMIYKEID
ncbi:MAG: CCA tRNA nucleotidyltransferase [Clostridioides sp.]|jgi:tRNA nucleotidyltransferase (CCA-adding enzyme)|nr:CCA tRNA nucleotidyltransferase [Clostridioides sp.]